jgi:hypothetical protein
MVDNQRQKKNGSPKVEIPYCEENRRLLDVFADAVRELALLHEEQFRAILSGDQDASRFDLLIHVAIEKKHAAKYAYLRHMEEHGC